MLHFLAEFKLPFLLAALLGLFLGWLLWRWRRGVINPGEYNRLLEMEGGYKSEISGLRTQHDTTRKELETARAHTGTLQGKLTNTEGELQTALADVGDLRGTLDGQVTRIASLESETSNFAGLQASFDAEASARAKLDADLKAANADRAKLDANLKAAVADRSKLETDLKAANADRAKLDANLKAAVADRSKLETDLGAHVNRISALETDTARVSDLESQLAAASGFQADFEASSSKVGALEDQVRALTVNLNDTTERNRDLEAELESVTAEAGNQTEAQSLLRGRIGHRRQ